MKKLLVLFLFLLAPQAHAAPSYDSNTDVSANSGVGVNITVNSGDTMLLVCGIDNSTNALTAVSGTVGGNAMTQLGTINDNVPNDQYCLYYLNPPTGTQSVVITETGGTAHLSRAELLKGTITSGWTPNLVQGHGNNNANLSTSITIAANTSWIFGAFRNDSSLDATSNLTVHAPSANNIFNADSNGTVSTGANTVTAGTSNTGMWEYFAVEIPIPPVASVTSILGLVKSMWLF